MAQRDVLVGPIQLADGVLVLRAPQLSDAAAWSAARLANREWLERAFPAWGDDWAAEQSPAAWVQRWWRLRRAAARGAAKPLVIVLDGELIGEIGVDAVDEVSGSGEASVWMVRSHGSADVMGLASLALLHFAFTCSPALDRVVSPVATTSRKGRSPGLTAAGLRIEATLPRRVGAAGLVDHDIWTIQNTAASRARLAALLDRFPSAPAPAGERVHPPAPAVARAALRELRAVLRARVRPAVPPKPPALTGGVELRAAGGRPVGHAPWQLTRGATVVGTVDVAPDAGTGCAEIALSVRDEADRGALGEALDRTLAAVAGGQFGAMHPAVRVPVDPGRAIVPNAEQLTAVGLTHVATFEGNPEGRRRWAGEQRWEPAR